MSSEQKFSTFPSNHTEALAYLYVQSQDLTGKTPAEIHNMYFDAYYEIIRENQKKWDDGWFNQKQEEAYSG